MHFAIIRFLSAVVPLFVLGLHALPRDLQSWVESLRSISSSLVEQASRSSNSLQQPLYRGFDKGRSKYGEVSCDSVSTYDTKYFLEKAIQPPKPGKCLFYTYGLSKDARKYARDHPSGLGTIWDIWPCDLYRGANTTDNPLRCIFENEAQRTTYFENMSRAMAMLCDVLATVMTKDIDRIPGDGIWGRVEDGTLKREDNPGGTVDKIFAIDSRKNSSMIWARSYSRARDEKPVEEPTVNKRCPEREECYLDDKLLEWFGDVAF